MKKIKVLALISLLAVITACGSADKKTEQVSTQPVVENPLAGYPAWVIDPTIEDGIAAVGSSKIGPAGMKFAKQEAMANARDELARQIGVKVQNMFKSYTNSIGMGGADGVEKVATNVSKQVANQTLVGSRQEELWISPDKELFMMMVIADDIVKQETLNLMNSQTPVGTSDKALWQEFKSEKAQQELDIAINEMLN